MNDLKIVSVSREKLGLVYAWFLNSVSSFFALDPQNKFFLATFYDFLKFYEQKFFIYEYFVLKGQQEIGLLRMILQPETRTANCDFWLAQFNEEDFKNLIELVKNYWLRELLYRKITTRIIFEKEYLKILKDAGFVTENILHEEFFYDGRYFNVETLGYIQENA